METRKTEYALLGGGCFWCLEAAFVDLPGVIAVTSGYAGGTRDSPTYEEVCTGATGHAEVVRVAFDPERISYEGILDLFWKIHDPTTLNQQGADIGTQYRSVIFYDGDDQEKAARASIAAQAARYDRPIVTQLLTAPRFWPAEDYHQGYFKAHPDAGYCRVVIAPKLAKLRAHLAK